MKNLAKPPAPTFESVWALLEKHAQEMEKSRIEHERAWEKSRIEHERERKQREQERKEREEKREQERKEREQERKKSEQERKEREEKREQERKQREQERKESEAKSEQERKEREEKFEREREKVRAEFDQRMKEADQRMKKLEELTGSWANNYGSFAEEYFFNSFENGKQNFFGERFDEIERNVKGINKGFRDEYDILLVNGKSIGIIEVKFKAHHNDLPQTLRKAQTFRVNFPEYQNHKVYLGLATMAFYPQLEQECIDQGIAVVKQVGDTVVINDAHLKAF